MITSRSVAGPMRFGLSRVMIVFRLATCSAISGCRISDCEIADAGMLGCRNPTGVGGGR
jgi:hypothetical protein